MHEQYMNRCLQLALLGAGNVAPNPMVGAVLVHEDHIIGEGFHRQYGQSHAEVNCINSVAEQNKKLVPGSTLYVSLEPCAHFGKTPPCADMIISHKIKRVVTGCGDPFTEVNGKGIAKMKKAGIDVIENILKEECIDINKRFFTYHNKHRPFIILKWAETADGFIAGPAGDRLKISNEFSDRLVHKWRSESAAIMVGTNTALSDNPSLTTRLWKGNNPVRVIIDSNLRLPTSLNIFTDGHKTIVLNTIKEDMAGPISYIKIMKDEFVNSICKVLYQLNLQSVLIEGGSILLTAFIDAGIWDEAIIIKNETLAAGNGMLAPKLSGASAVKKEKIFSDSILYFKNDGAVLQSH